MDNFNMPDNNTTQNFDGYQDTPAPKNGLGIASLILSILGLLTCCFFGVPAIILGIVGIVLAIICKHQNGSFPGVAIAGLVLSIISTLIGITYLTLIIVGFYGTGYYSEVFKQSYYDALNRMR